MSEEREIVARARARIADNAELVKEYKSMGTPAGLTDQSIQARLGAHMLASAIYLSSLKLNGHQWARANREKADQLKQNIAQHIATLPIPVQSDLGAYYIPICVTAQKMAAQKVASVSVKETSKRLELFVAQIFKGLPKEAQIQLAARVLFDAQRPDSDVPKDIKAGLMRIYDGFAVLSPDIKPQVAAFYTGIQQSCNSTVTWAMAGEGVPIDRLVLVSRAAIE